MLRYEDLIHPERKIHALRKIVDFTHLGLKRVNRWESDDLEAGEKVKLDEVNAAEMERVKNTTPADEEYRRLQCAFVLSDRDEIHRKNDHTSQTFVKSKDAYSYENKATKHVVCNAWKTLQRSADLMQRYGYYHGPNSKEPVQLEDCADDDSPAF